MSSARPRSIEKPEQHAELIVDLLDQAHIGRDHPRAHLVAGKIARRPHRHQRAVDRVRIDALGLAAQRRRDTSAAVQVVIGRRRDIGPVRLDVGEVQAPRAAVLPRLVDKLHRAAGGVGRFRMLLGDPRRLVGMGQQPAVEHPAVRALGGIGPFLPRIGGIETVLAQIGRRSAAAAAARRMHPVVALVGLEAALREMHALGREPGRCRAAAMPSMSAAIWVLPTSTLRTPNSRRWSPRVGSPTRSGKPFQFDPCERM